MSDPSCRNFRELLGVYVVGAIEPGERAAVDAHLGQCYECREELAGLAPLPALMHRVPREDAERIMLGNEPAEDHIEPSADMLDSLLAKAGAKRRTRRVRAMFAAAAAVLIAVGGATAAAETLAQHHHAVQVEVASSSNGSLGATVRYRQNQWGTHMWVQVSGFHRWTDCKFWVVTKSGHWQLAGGWLVGPDAGDIWYPVEARIREARVTGFVITAHGKTLLQIPAA